MRSTVQLGHSSDVAEIVLYKEEGNNVALMEIVDGTGGQKDTLITASLSVSDIERLIEALQDVRNDITSVSPHQS